MDAHFWEQVERSKQLTPEERFLGTCEMSDLTRQINLDGIRHQFPNATEREVFDILAERYRIMRKLESSNEKR